MSILMLSLGAPLAAFAQQMPPVDTGGNDNDMLKKFILDDNHAANEGFLAPSGRFRVKVPSNMQQQDSKDPDTITFEGEVGRGTPFMLIFRRISVTPGASPGQLMLTTRDRFTQKLANYEVLKTAQVKISGRTAAWMMGRYDFNGHIGYSQIVENAFVVDGGDGFIIHSEVSESQYNDVADILNQVYKSFRTIAPPPDKPVAPPPAEPKPKGKKKR